MNLLKNWFARQSLTVRLIVSVPLLLAAIFWSLTPDDAVPAAPGSATNRPVLSVDAPSAEATIAPHQEPRAPDSGLSWATALRTIVSVAVVVGLIVLSARGLKHVMANAGQLPGASGALKVLDTTYLPSPNGRGRAAIHLVETIDGRHLLIGATDTQLTLLTEYDDRLRAAADDAPVQAPLSHVARRTPDRDGEPFEEPELTRPARFDEVLERLRQSARAIERAS